MMENWQQERGIYERILREETGIGYFDSFAVINLIFRA